MHLFYFRAMHIIKYLLCIFIDIVVVLMFSNGEIIIGNYYLLGFNLF